MTESMIERIAEAIYNDDFEGAPPTPFSEREADVVVAYLSNARAALEALKVPTEAMLDAAEDTNKGGGVTDQGGAEPDIYDVWTVWQAMIDAALSETP